MQDCRNSNFNSASFGCIAVVLSEFGVTTVLQRGSDIYANSSLSACSKVQDENIRLQTSEIF